MTLKNSGLNDEMDVTVNLIVDGVVLNSTDISSIAQESTVPLHLVWTPTSPGVYRIDLSVTEVPGEAITFDNHLSTGIDVPVAGFSGEYFDYGSDTDGDGLYGYLTIEVGVGVAAAGNYRIYGELYDEYGSQIGYEGSDYVYLGVGSQSMPLEFNGIKIRQNGVNGTYNLRYLNLYEEGGNQLGVIDDAYTTTHYNYTEFQRLPAKFSGEYSDYGTDTDGDGLYDHLTIEVGMDVAAAGYYPVGGWLDDSYRDCIGHCSNYTYLNTGNQAVQLDFSGIAIRQNEVNGTYNLSYLCLYGDCGNRLERIRDAHTTSCYNYTEFQISPARFSGEYSDYGTDTDGDMLYDHLSIEVGVDVATAGYYRVMGNLEDSYGDYIEYRSNHTYLNTGNQAVQLDFRGITIRQNEVNGTYNLDHLYLYGDHGNQLGYLRDAHTTLDYNYTEFQRPPARFSGEYSDYGADTDGDGLYDYLTIEVGVDVATAGEYYVGGGLYDSYGDYIEYSRNYIYLNAGNQAVQLDFRGIAIRQNEVNGTYNLSGPCMYTDRGDQLGYLRDAHTTSYYDYTEFQRPPARFSGEYSDYGIDTDGDGLYDYLTIEVDVDVITSGYYRVMGNLEDSYGDYIEYRSNHTYLNTGNQAVQLDFSGITIRQNEVNGTYNISYLYLYDDPGNRLEYLRDTHTTLDYDYTEFQRPPARFSDEYSDYGADTDGDGLYDYLTIEVGVDVITSGYYQVEGWLDDSCGYRIEYSSNYTYLNTGNHTVQLDFSGITIRQNDVDGTYNLSYLCLYNYHWKHLKHIRDVYTTSYYHCTEFQRPPARFSGEYSDYGVDTDGDGLYDHIPSEVGVDAITAGIIRYGNCTKTEHVIM